MDPAPTGATTIRFTVIDTSSKEKKEDQQ